MSIEQSIPDARETLRSLFQAYFNERDMERTLAFFTEDASFVDENRHESANNRDELAFYLTKARNSRFAGYKVSDSMEKELPGGVLTLCRLSVELPLYGGGLSAYDTRVTAVVLPSDGRYLIKFLHLAAHSCAPRGPKSRPLHFTDAHALALWPEAKARLSRLFEEAVPGGILGCYLEPGYPLYVVGEPLLQYLGYTYETLREETRGLFLPMLHPDDRQAVMRAVSDCARAGGTYDVRCRIKKQDGSHLWVRSRGGAVKTGDGRAAIISIAVDISEIVRLQEQFEREAAFDSLTQVYNRREAQRLIERDLTRYGGGALLLLDIDNFKALNDARGHKEGDEMLVQLSRILKENVRLDDIVARLGGDEFAVYLHGVPHREDVVLQAKRLYHVFQERFQDLCRECGLDLSIGGVLASHSEDFSQLYDIANKMRNQCKTDGKYKAKVEIY